MSTVPWKVTRVLNVAQVSRQLPRTCGGGQMYRKRSLALWMQFCFVNMCIYIVLNCSCLFLLWCWTASVKTCGPTPMVWVCSLGRRFEIVPFDIQACAQLTPNTKGGYCNFAASNSVSLKTRISKSWKLRFCGYHAVNEVLSQAEPCGSRAWQLDLRSEVLIFFRCLHNEPCESVLIESEAPFFQGNIELWNWYIVLG